MAEKQAKLSTRAFVEALGIFFFVFVGAGSVITAHAAGLGITSLLVIAIANGIGLALAISFTMNISGGHINPAVTIAALINNKIKLNDAIVYIIAQVVGAVIAGLLLIALFPTLGSAVNYGSPSLSASTTVMSGILLETVMTFFLVTAVFLTAVDRRAPRIAGFGVGLTVVMDVLVGGPFTGAAMNPARAIGPMLASGFLSNWYVYWIGPILGAIIAALVYKYFIAE